MQHIKMLLKLLMYVLSYDIPSKTHLGEVIILMVHNSLGNYHMDSDYYVILCGWWSSVIWPFDDVAPQYVHITLE